MVDPANAAPGGSRSPGAVAVLVRAASVGLGVLCVAATMLACGEEVSTLRLIGGLDGAEPRGLVCRQEADPDKLMAERGLEAGRASMIVDFIRLGGTPGCRTGELVQWCMERGCSPILEHRACVDIDLTGVTSIVGAAEALLAALDRFQVSRNAPQEPVVIRTILSAQPCSSVPGPGSGDPDVACDALMGCLYTCPVTLGEAEGDIVLDFDVLGDACEAEVRICASSQNFATATCSD